MYASADVQLLLEVWTKMEKFRWSEQLLRQVWHQTNTIMFDALAEVEADAAGMKDADGTSQEATLSSRFKVVMSKMSLDRHCEIVLDNEYGELLAALPEEISALLVERLPDGASTLVDVILDLHRPVTFIANDRHPIRVRERTVTRSDIEHVMIQIFVVTVNIFVCRCFINVALSQMPIVHVLVNLCTDARSFVSQNQSKSLESHCEWPALFRVLLRPSRTFLRLEEVFCWWALLVVEKPHCCVTLHGCWLLNHMESVS